jgi:indole-3-glycerol phosphate synthase
MSFAKKKNFLPEIVARKRHVIAKLRAETDADAWRSHAREVRQDAGSHRLRHVLEATSPSLNIIAEFKRTSPSLGVIRADFSPADAARAYERGGACAISVLTEEEFFGGSIDDLIAIRAQTRLPILRKDFVVDPIQIYEAAVAGADAVLLIAAVLDDSLLEEMRTTAEDELGLDALIEVHTSAELERALKAGANLIGVNNRDLHTFEISLSTSELLIAQAPRDKIMISESGLKTANTLRHLQALGFRGFLIGETLMRANDPAAALRDLGAIVDPPHVVRP